MCGRYVRKDGTAVFSFFEINHVRISWEPNYNVAPTMKIPVIRLDDDGARELVEMTWGLRPFWAKPDVNLPMMINARAETVATKSSYRSAFKSRRCIVPASGYHEWQKLPQGKKPPFYFERKDGPPLAFAGLWDGETVATNTTEPNRETSPVDDRMPVIINTVNLARFLNPEPLTVAEQRAFLPPVADGTLNARPVSTRVGNVRNNDQGLIEPVPSEGELFSRPLKVADFRDVS